MILDAAIIIMPNAAGALALSLTSAGYHLPDRAMRMATLTIPGVEARVILAICADDTPDAATWKRPAPWASMARAAAV